MWGYVIDPQGEGSFAFGGTDDFKAVRSENKFTLSRAIKDLEHMFGCVVHLWRGQDDQTDFLGVECRRSRNAASAPLTI